MPSKEKISKVDGRSVRFRPLHVAAKDSTSARRVLFGPSDHQENARVLTELSDQLNQQAKIRWNFDFLNCKPLSGRYEWSCTEAMEAREPAASSDDVNDRVNDVTSGIDVIEDGSRDPNNKTVCDEMSPSFTVSSSSPKYEQMMSNLMKLHSKKIIRRLTWAPKKKMRFLSRTSRRLQREATIPDYYPVRKRLEF